MEQRAGEVRSAALSTSCAEICSSPKMNGVTLHVRAVSRRARQAKFLMKTWTTPTILRNACTLERSAHGPQLTILSTTTFGSADMAYNCDFVSTNKGLLTGKHSSTIFHMLHYSIDILEVFPNEAANATIFQNSLKDSIIILISRCRAVNRYIVNIWNSIFWNFRLKDVSYIVMEYGNCICPSHW